MVKILLLLIYLAFIISVIFIERKNPSEALLWILIMICFPFVGVLLYMAFGSTICMKIISTVRGKRQEDEARKYIYDNFERQKISIYNKSLKISECDRSVIRFNQNYNNTPLTVCENIDIFTSGQEHYKSLFNDIKNAKDSLYINFFTIQNDIVGKEFLKLLSQKAKEGVKVWLMCDFVTNFIASRNMFKELKQCGGEVKIIKPYLTHFRNHRKIVIIDEKIGYIGGMNIGNQYANMHKFKNPWRDTQIRVTGQGVFMLIYYFMTDWICVLSKKELESKKGKLFSDIKAANNFGNIPCQFVAGGVYNNKESIKMCYLSLIRNAKEKIRIQSPYFVPDESILDAIKTAIASGIKVEIMVPGVKASFFLDPTTTYYLGEILEYGATVYKYNGYIHAKTIVIDDEICGIGSVNMDIRSLKVDDEICGIFYDNSFVKRYNNIFTNDIISCKQYTYDEFKNRGIKQKILERIYVLFAPLM